MTSALLSRFQSPRNRVNTSKSSSPSCRGAASSSAGFNPLEIGSTLQNHLRLWRVHRPPVGFNPLEIGSTLQKQVDWTPDEEMVSRGFNPLEIGSTLQNFFSSPSGPPATMSFNPLEIGSTLQNGAVKRCGRRLRACGFNPLEIGSTLQNVLHDAPSHGR